MEKKSYLISVLLLAFLFSCKESVNSKSGQEPEKPVKKEYYTNPIIKMSLPDPTVIRADDGSFYLYATEDIHNLPIFKSRDLIEWSQVGTAFTNETRPNLVKGGALWAPEIRKIKDKYVLFYSLAIWGNHWVSTIGYAVADKPEGPFTEKGKVFDSRDVDVENSIDQFFFEDNRKYYMVWGSFRGLYIMELNISDNLDITYNLDTKQRLAGDAYEGVNIWKRGDYYYLFASVGSCCEGEKSTYKTVVGRSKSLFGPYVNKEGKTMLDNSHEDVIAKGNGFVGTGHNSILIEDDAKNTWMIYHAFQLDALQNSRQVLLDKVLWDAEGWPYVQNGIPSLKAEVPVINKK